MRPQVLILGSTGNLASELRKMLTNCDIFTGSHSDLSADFIISNKGIVRFCPLVKELDVVIFGSSFDKFIACENNPDLAYAINVKLNILIFQQLTRYFEFTPIILSTDAVYSGMEECFLTENITPNPLSIYGKSKRMLEEYFLLNSKRSCIIRMSKLWGGRGCFIPHLAHRLNAGESILGITDQYFRPLNIHNAVSSIDFIIRNRITGIVHIAGPELLSWYSIMFRLFEISKHRIISISYREMYASNIRPKTLDLISDNKLILPLISKFKIIAIESSL